MRALDANSFGELALRDIGSSGHDDFEPYATLVRQTFGSDAIPGWDALAAFDTAGACVAGLQRAVLGLRVDGELVRCAAIANVAVAEAWRGRGLMGALFARQIPWGEARAAASLLYAETPKLYARFGFVPLAQYAFEGSAPDPLGPGGARRVVIPQDDDLLARLLARRAPLSTRVFVADDRGLTARALRRDHSSLFYEEAADFAVLIEDDDDDCLVIADVIAPVMPTASRILGALGLRRRRLRTLFPPDRLSWMGEPVFVDAGLLMRGAVPAALTRPFLLPPTVEF